MILSGAPRVVSAEEVISVAANVESGESEIEVSAKSAVLMEASSGKILYEKKKDERVCPASITKIMTLVLIFDAIQEGKIQLTDEVVTSEHAKAMGGSQVFLETGEKQSVETMIKCIVIASGNDASVAMAEYICGTEEAFVKQMNQKARKLGMKNTHFEDACGLTDSDGHYTSAYDVALMARKLITDYPEISKYATIWMEDITHVTEKGTKPFTLTNTNKLLKQYHWITGLKTGSTNKAKYCVCATARQNNMDLIAVIMGAPDYKVRFLQAASLLKYGYANYSVYCDDKKEKIPFEVENAMKPWSVCEKRSVFSSVLEKNKEVEKITTKTVFTKKSAPIKKGEKVGIRYYQQDGKIIGQMDLVATQNVKKANYGDYFSHAVASYLNHVLQ